MPEVFRERLGQLSNKEGNLYESHFVLANRQHEALAASIAAEFAAEHIKSSNPNLELWVQLSSICYLTGRHR